MNKNSLSKYSAIIAILLLTATAFGQFVESGKITYERKTNLLKIPNLPPFLKQIAEEKKYNVDEFVLTFNSNGSSFIPKNASTSTGPADMLSIKNTVYSNRTTGNRMTLLDIMGNKIFINDTVNKINWTMTDNTRKLAGYDCKMAIYRKDDSTRLYAWYAEELIPAVGPETFSGLPGTILGLATEDGGVVYFAKSVEITPVNDKDLSFETGKIKVYSKTEFAAEIAKQMGNNPMVKGMIASFFRWY
ncbi:MAG: GLPGLI family protein [Crocinitomicaceae bacterium]|nr:GLPGLI family protein [Crocinitomicaceae bacterium]